MKSKISVIIPAYNAEKSIEKCVSSVLCQSLSAYEIIVIDDGSKDRTGEILDRLAKDNSNLRVLHQENRGVSFARNKGIDLAGGDYIFFMDSDDWIQRDTLSEFLKHTEEESLPLTGFALEDGSDSPKECVFEQITPQKVYSINIFEQLFCEVAVHYLWNKLFRCDIIKKENIRFDEKLALGEDLLFNLEYLKHVDRIKLIRKPLYRYSVQNDNSLRHQVYRNQLEIDERLNRAVYDFCMLRKKDLGNHTGLAMKFCMKLLMNGYMNYFENGEGNILHRYSLIKKEMKTSVLQDILTEGERTGSVEIYRRIFIKKRMFLSYYIAYKLVKK